MPGLTPGPVSTASVPTSSYSGLWSEGSTEFHSFSRTEFFQKGKKEGRKMKEVYFKDVCVGRWTISIKQWFPGGSNGKEFACNAGGPGVILG